MADTFRKEYIPLTKEQIDRCAEIKDSAELLLKIINDMQIRSDQRCRALSVVNLEQAVMWAIKAIT
jgi:hypothetical protein